MKTALAITAAVVILFAVFGDNWTTRQFGGTMEVDLPEGQKLINVTWKQNDLWILTRDARPGERSENYKFDESSALGIFEGTVKIRENLKEHHEQSAIDFDSGIHVPDGGILRNRSTATHRVSDSSSFRTSY